MVLVHERLGRNRDARDALDAHTCTHGDAEEGASHDYHPRRGGCYDSSEDQSPSPGLPGPQAFGRHILNAKVPTTDQYPTVLWGNKPRIMA